MKRCSSCGLTLEDVAAKFCPQCGAVLESQGAPPSAPPAPAGQDEDDFQVVEAHHDDAGFLSEDNPSSRAAGDSGERESGQLDIEDNDPDALGDPDFSQAPIIEPIDAPEPPSMPTESAESFLTGRPGEPSEPPKSEPDPADPNALPRLSNEQVSEIEQRMQIKQNSYISEEEKRRLLESMDKTDQPFGNTPIVPPKKAQAKAGGKPTSPGDQEPKDFQPVFHGGATDIPVNEPAVPTDDPEQAAQAPRGVAYFYKNLVQLEGSPHLHNHDELQLGERIWILKRKQFSPTFILAVLSPVAALLLFIVALQFVNTGGRGDGSMIGMVVDEYEQPFVHGAMIRLPEIGKAYESNAEGFFVTDNLPAGTYRVEWVLDGTVVGSAHTTVVDGKVSTMTIRPAEEIVEQFDSQPAAQPRAEARSNNKSAGSASQQASRQPSNSSRGTSTKQNSSSKSASRGSSKKSGGSSKKTSSTAKIALEANIDNAKLMLDGKVLGRGNLTYSRISPGDHSYMVIADGYESISGRVKLTAGKTKTLNVALPILAKAEKEETYSADDFYYSGANAVRDGEYETAVQDLTEAIRLDPNYVKAYSARGEAHARLREKDKSHDDFVRAAEIHRFNKDYNYAITAYNEALQMNEESVTAHMGRASLFMAKHEEVAAIADFESVIRIDRRNYEAYLGLGKARFARSNYKKAIKAFKDARSIREDDPMVHQYLMLAYMADSEFDEVQKSYEKFVEVASPEDVASFKKDRTYSAIMRVVKEEN